jgi:hypothetical protein
MPRPRPRRRPAPTPQRPRRAGRTPPSPAPAGTGLRASVERASVGPLVTLTRLPRWIPGLGIGALLVIGLFVPGALGALALVPVALLLTWLTFLSWPVLGYGPRLLRLAVLLVVAGYVGARLLGKG